ncbi:MAG: hypothetical protein IKN62_00560 [Elusimicrobia bacterium]|nr:hypothetical protein [Elusimicrobiota bacterium]
MYSFNYIEGVITKEKYSNVLVRVIKLANFLVHVLIVLIILFAILKGVETGTYNSKIAQAKNNIENKRSASQIVEIEKEWENCYYKIMAVKEQLKESTTYGSVLKDFGTYLPDYDAITKLSMEANTANLELFVNRDKLKKMTSFYDYAPVLSSSFEKSEYIKNKMLIETMERQKIHSKELGIMKIKAEIKEKK